MMGLLETLLSPEKPGGKASEPMEHHEAIEMMASERYMLEELTPELRDAFEEHLFGCRECADEVRFGAAFVDNAKAVLPTMATKRAPVAGARLEVVSRPQKDKHDWFSWSGPAWLRSGIVAPTFACLLAACLLVVVGYQNLVVLPALEASATAPRVLPPATALLGITRGGTPIVYADPVAGSTLTLPLPAGSAYVSYKFGFYDATGKLVWTRTMPSAGAADDLATIWLPGQTRPDTYKLATTGITPSGEEVTVQQEFFYLRVKK